MKYLLSLILILARAPAFASTPPAEPPIYSLMIIDDITLSDKWIPLHQHMVVNTSITTEAGSALFNLTEDGIVAAKDGLYRLSFYQRLMGNSSSNICALSLYVDDDEYLKRYHGVSVGGNEPAEITFTQILRIQAGQKLMLDLTACGGSISLESNFNSSGFTIEAL